MILQENDPLFWPNVDLKQSLFLHKLAVKRVYAKRGISSNMIGWAKELGNTMKKSYIRLDCASNRPHLCEFYEENGFVKVMEQLILNKYPTSFYEYKIV
ncbi:MAG: GNAT family N-acetyltransferase [Bacillota bacterium]